MDTDVGLKKTIGYTLSHVFDFQNKKFPLSLDSVLPVPAPFLFLGMWPEKLEVMKIKSGQQKAWLLR